MLGKYNIIVNSYESYPDGNGPFPAIVLFMHAYGLDDFSKKVCDDLAKAGYIAVAADGYLNGIYTFQTRSDDAIFGAADLLIHTLKKREDVDSDRIGVIGFCMGGRHAYLFNANRDDLKAIVAYYGFPQRGDNEENTPQKRIQDFIAPVLSIFGSEDQGIPMEAVNEYIKETEGGSSLHKSVVYDGAAHGFLSSTSRNYHEEAAKDAWRKTVEFFDKYLK
jgi:carboxymethylenebutenolidase